MRLESDCEAVGQGDQLFEMQRCLLLDIKMLFMKLLFGCFWKISLVKKTARVATGML